MGERVVKVRIAIGTAESSGTSRSRDGMGVVLIEW